MPYDEQQEKDFSLKDYFVPLTTAKAIHFIIIIGFLVFGTILFNSFVWDDLTYIVSYQDIHTFNIFTLLGKNIFNVAGYYVRFLLHTFPSYGCLLAIMLSFFIYFK